MVARESPSYYYAYLSATLVDTQQKCDSPIIYFLNIAISLDIIDICIYETLVQYREMCHNFASFPGFQSHVKKSHYSVSANLGLIG